MGKKKANQKGAASQGKHWKTSQLSKPSKGVLSEGGGYGKQDLN